MPLDKQLIERLQQNDAELTSLDLSYQALTDSDIEALTNALANNTYLTSLDLTGNPLSLISVKRLVTLTTLKELSLSGCKLTAETAPFLSSMPNLQVLKLNYNHLGPKGAEAFIDNMTLVSLELVDNQLSDEGAIAIAKNRHLQQVNLASNDIANEGTIALAKHPALIHLVLTSNQVGAFGAAALARNTRLRVLHLSYNRIGTEGAYTLSGNKTLEELNVGYNAIGKQGIAKFGQNTSIKILGLAGNGIMEDDIEPLAQNQTLISLDVSYNQLNDVGTKTFDQNHSLTHLNISYNYVYAEGVKHLANLKTLKWLDISHNAIGDEGGVILSKHRGLIFLNVAGCELTSTSAVAFSHSSSLITLLMDFNQVDNVGAMALNKNKTLRHLTLGYNSIKDEGGLAFSDNTTLETLSLNYNRLGEAGVQSLKQNKAIKTVKVTLEPPPNFSSDNLKRLFLMSQEFFCLLNNEGFIQFFNPTFSRILDYRADELLAKSAKEFIHPEDRSLKIEHVNEKVQAYTQENRYLCKDGSFRMVHWRCHLIENQIFAVGRDITELRKTEKKLHEREEQRQLSEVRQEQSDTYRQKQTDFIAHLCHEIRNPLSAVMGYLDILSDHISSLESALATNPLEDVEEIKQILQVIKACTEHQKVILDNNLDANMLEGRKLSLNSAPFDPKDVIQSAVKILRGKATQKNIKINVSLPDDEVWVNGDDFRFKQIALNLLGNAIKFTEKGHVHIVLTILEQTAKETQLELKVKDTGVGMTSDELNKLFQRFSQANQSVGARYGGSGLGLFITKKLAELMDGNINVKSTQGKGTVFSCTLKLKTVVKQLQEEPVSTPYERIFSPQCYTVLIVDDNEINQKLLKSIVERGGHTCLVAKDGHEAIVFYEHHNPDIIFMDILMPRMNGIEATLAIRRIEQQTHQEPVPIVALSGNAQEHDKQQAFDAGMNDYVTKPFKREQIYEKIRGFCQKQTVVLEDVVPQKMTYSL
ncbi:MAG: multi-sensor hybrid histidine kinase [Gammaproteobacteria bacterium]|nr:multi-sensor hybrid histidine kinase [Gammaproteobacteria bacterium]